MMVGDATAGGDLPDSDVPAGGDEADAGPVRFGGVIFDLDGVVADTEHLWDASWAACSVAAGQPWGHADSETLLGLSVPEWSAELARRNGDHSPEGAIRAAKFCIDYILSAIDDGRGELMDGGRELVEYAAARGPIALATSSARPIIDHLLTRNGLAGMFSATVSSAEVPRGKPSPDVYQEAARRSGLDTGPAIGIEDSSNGIRSAHAAGLYVIAIPNRQFPPAADVLALADHVAPDHAAALAQLKVLLPDTVSQ
ncbi:HAD superfamily hydrolase (TIGR01509 family) [Nakamurella sp. UYEF19]|uniref:HAD family hydrolase n=1 Tax=Nakamurella sp. UYEF19 TaxID=1756392 RepID=UPI0033972B28